MITPKQLGFTMSAVGIVAGLLSSWSSTWPRWKSGSLGQHAFATEVALSLASCVALVVIVTSLMRDMRRRIRA